MWGHQNRSRLWGKIFWYSFKNAFWWSFTNKQILWFVIISPPSFTDYIHCDTLNNKRECIIVLKLVLKDSWFISHIHPFFCQHFSGFEDQFASKFLVAFKLLTVAKNLFRVELYCDGGNFWFDGLSHTCLFHHCHSGWAYKNFPHVPRTPGLLWRHGRQWDRRACYWAESQVTHWLVNFNHKSMGSHLQQCSSDKERDPVNNKVFMTFLNSSK